MQTKEVGNLTNTQKNVISAQWAFDAEIKSFEAISMVDNDEELEECSKKCHEALDILLAAKQAMFKECISKSFKFM